MKPKGYYKLQDLLFDYWETWKSGEDIMPLSEYLSSNNQDNASIRGLLNLSDNIEYVKSLIPKESREDFFKDLYEFEEIDKQAGETSTLGSSILSFNQGIAVKPESLLYKLYNLNKIIMRRMTDLGLLDFNKNPIKAKKFIQIIAEYSGEDTDVVT